MTDEVQELAQRLVIGRKRDGRCKYDEAAKAELVALCHRPETSVSRLARECGINANQLSRWIREHGRKGSQVMPTIMPVVSLPPTAFVPVEIAPAPVSPAVPPVQAVLDLQARLPNGVAIELRGLGPQQVGPVIDALGRLQCSVSTKG